MEADIPKNLFIRELAARHRVILLGGMAVIAHGFSRQTKDFDIWLEPFSGAHEWAAMLLATTRVFPEAKLWSLAQRRELADAELAAEAEDSGVVRINGFALPVDVFRKPNEMEPEDFERVWAATRRMDDKVALPDEIDLYLTKANTGRENDWHDRVFLEGRVKQRYRERLPVCDAAEARGLMERFLDPEVLAFALENPDAEVRAMALAHLREFEAEGDPYSRDILAAWRTKNPSPG